VLDPQNGADVTDRHSGFAGERRIGRHASAATSRLLATTLIGLTATLHVALAQAPVRHVVTTDDGHPLTVWEKKGPSARHTIVLLHGRTWSSIPDFDLQVPGHPSSLMDALVEHGYDVYALDARGYGGTARDSSGWLTPDRAVKDVITVCRWVAAHSGVSGKPALFGWSYGSVTAQLAAQRSPGDISALVLFGHFAFPPTPPEPTGPPPRVKTTAKAAGEDFITPAATDSSVVREYVRAAVAADPVRVDWNQIGQWNALDPAAVHVPTLEIMGERDPVSTKPPSGEATFFGQLGTPDREFVVLPGVDHAGFLENQRARFVEAMVDFLTRPRAPAP
jgi:alpha-beta hydrolase superfamily lysophospholipase